MIDTNTASNLYEITRDKLQVANWLELIQKLRYARASQLGGNYGQGHEVEYGGRLRELADLESMLKRKPEDYYKEMQKNAAG